MLKTRNLRRAAVAAAVAGSIAFGATTLGGGQAVAAPAPSTAAPAAETAAAETPTNVDLQSGVVLEGFATIAGQEAFLELYDNSKYGSSIRIIVGDIEDGGFFGYAEQQTAFVVDGQVHATVELDGKDAVISGTLVENGAPTRIRDNFQDGGAQLNTKGTNTQLLADVTITFEGATIPVEVGTAFAYDLQTRTVELYGTN